MITQYKLNDTLKRVIQDFEDAVYSKAVYHKQLGEERADAKYREVKAALIDLIGEMDSQLYHPTGGLAKKRDEKPKTKKHDRRTKRSRPNKR